MAKNNKRHLYYDRQVPTEKLADAEHARVTSRMFASHPPTEEDEYITRHEREHKQDARQEAKREKKPPFLYRVKETAHPAEDRPKSLWRRFIHALRKWDFNWRP